METKQKLRKRSASPRARFTASSKNSPWRLNCSANTSLALAAALFLSAVAVFSDRCAAAQADPPAVAPSEIPIFASADDNALPVGTLARGEHATPIAETQGAGGLKWYLVKSRSGVVGWIKQTDSDQSRKVERFFKALPPEPSATAVIPNVSSAAAPQGAIIVPVLSTGRSTIVAVTLNHSIKANLVLDTGATNTVISRRIAGLLSLRPIGTAAVQTVGGTVAAPFARLQSMKVGDAEISNLPVLIHDFSADPRYEGLLGMDFLGRYQMGLDSKRQVLVLTPR